jgi:hypothetical protein
MGSFEERLSRATPQHRPQYLRIKATEILDRSDDPVAWHLAASLLTRVIDDYPDSLDAAMAHHELARYHRRLGEWDAALREYQLAIDLSLSGRSGSTGIEEVDMAEVLVERDAPGDATTALQLLTSEHLASQSHFNSTLFRIALCRARARSRLNLDPSAAACEALRLASITEPQLPRHPTVGLVKADQQTLRELEQYTSS